MRNSRSGDELHLVRCELASRIFEPSGNGKLINRQKEEDGVMTIKFKEATAAQACVMKMNGRFFDGRKVSFSNPRQSTGHS